MSSVLHCGWLQALARVKGKAVDVVGSADVVDTVAIADAVSGLSSQSPHLSLSSSSDTRQIPHHLPSPTTSSHLCPSHPRLAQLPLRTQLPIICVSPIHLIQHIT